MMVIEGCTCNFGIPGVFSLPYHSHNTAASDIIRLNPRRPDIDDLIARHFPLADEIHIWVDWKEVAKELGDSLDRVLRVTRL